MFVIEQIISEIEGA